MSGPAGKMNQTQQRWLRSAVQVGFVVFSLLVGWQFHRFVMWLADPRTMPPERPASVEAWLPISSLMSLSHLLRTGEASRVHPAGLVIFLLILALSAVMGRGFCSWVCPIGTLSEWAHGIGRRLFGRNLVLPRWLDIPLRLLKYLLLGFFVYAVVMMSGEALQAFLDGPYNRLADVKMYLLFAEISRTTAIVLGVLLLLSIFIQNFWCRYLCPYGALLGLFSLVSPVAVRRDAERCTGCRQCERACPNRLQAWRHQRVRSLECTMCFSCVQACPVAGTLDVTLPASRRRFSMAGYAAVLLAAFILVPDAARAMGYWQSNTPPYLYARLYKVVRQIDHPRTVDSLERFHPPLPSAPGQSDHRLPAPPLQRPAPTEG